MVAGPRARGAAQGPAPQDRRPRLLLGPRPRLPPSVLPLPVLPLHLVLGLLPWLPPVLPQDPPSPCPRQVAGALGIIAATSPALAAVSLAVAPLLSRALSGLVVRSAALSYEQQAAAADALALAGSRLTAVQTVQARAPCSGGHSRRPALLFCLRLTVAGISTARCAAGARLATAGLPH